MFSWKSNSADIYGIQFKFASIKNNSLHVTSNLIDTTIFISFVIDDTLLDKSS